VISPKKKWWSFEEMSPARELTAVPLLVADIL